MRVLPGLLLATPPLRADGRRDEDGLAHARDILGALFGNIDDAQRCWKIVGDSFTLVTLPRYRAGWLRNRAQLLQKADWCAMRSIAARGPNLVWPAKKRLPQLAGDLFAEPENCARRSSSKSRRRAAHGAESSPRRSESEGVAAARRSDGKPRAVSDENPAARCLLRRGAEHRRVLRGALLDVVN